MMYQVLVVSSILLWAATLFNFLLIVALIQRRSRNDFQGVLLTNGQDAPELDAETLQGNTVTLADYAGHSVAFLFIGTNCPPCREAIPSYESMRLDAVRSGVELVLVSLDDAERTRALTQELDIQLPILVAPRESSSFAKNYGVIGTPFYCLVDSQGRVESTGHPHPERGEWKSLTDTWKAGENETTKPMAQEMNHITNSV